MNINGCPYEGLEAIIIDGNEVYLSVETTETSLNCYIVKGYLNDTSLIMNSSFLLPVPRFKNVDGSFIPNAGFESVVKVNDFLFSFFEFNYFNSNNKVCVIDKYSFQVANCLHYLPMNKLPFRLTDITCIGSNHFTAINYFYKGDEDAVVYTPSLCYKHRTRSAMVDVAIK